MITVESIPYISLGVVGIGFLIVILGILALAHQQSGDKEHTQYVGENNDSSNVKEMFSYFLEEEEKKNNALRESLVQERVKPTLKNHEEEFLYREMIERHTQGETIEQIAKNLKIGIGEVKLILSLYNMR